MKLVTLASLVAASFVAVSAQAATVDVTPGSLNGWKFYSTNSSGTINTGSATSALVNGIATPPIGAGSAHFATGAGAGDGSGQARLSGWAGTRIDALTSLSYSTYATAWNGSQVPYITIYLDTNGDNIRDDRLWFEPTYSRAAAGNGNPSPQADPVLNTWQSWDLLTGMWYSDAVPGPGSNAKTLAQYLALKPDATIIEDVGQTDGGSPIGGIRVASGFASAGNSFDAYIDAFTIGTASGTITYNFELPEPATLTAIAGVAMVGLRRRA